MTKPPRATPQARRSLPPSKNQPIPPVHQRSQRVSKALAISLIVGASASVTAAMVVNQGFAAAGLAKRLSLPLIYIVFLYAFIARNRAEKPTRLYVPGIWQIFIIIVLASTTVPTLIAGLTTSQSINISAGVQGLALAGGGVLAVMLGWSAQVWTPKAATRVSHTILFLGLASGASGLTFVPFASLFVPAVFYLTYLILVGQFNRPFGATLLSVSLGFWVTRSIIGAHQPVSVAFLLEVLGCAVILILTLAPAAYRLPIIATVIIGGLTLVAIQSSSYSFVFGTSTYQDVTLAQRGYETAQVTALLDSHPASWLFGLGPSGVVNLVLSPDAATLAASGRDLTSVDDVHLLSTYYLLKFGLVGLIWMFCLIAYVSRLVYNAVQFDRRNSFNILMCFCLAGGVLVGVPAATNFLASPLPYFAAGVLARSLIKDTTSHSLSS